MHAGATTNFVSSTRHWRSDSHSRLDPSKPHVYDLSNMSQPSTNLEIKRAKQVSECTRQALISDPSHSAFLCSSAPTHLRGTGQLLHNHVKASIAPTGSITLVAAALQQNGCLTCRLHITKVHFLPGWGIDSGIGPSRYQVHT